MKKFFIIIIILLSFSTDIYGNSSLENGEKLLSSTNINGAITQFSDVLKSEPMNVEALFGLGRAYLFISEFKKSEMYLNTALNLSPDNPYIYYEYGRLKFATNQYEDALYYLLSSLFIAKNKKVYRLLGESLSELGFVNWANQIFEEGIALYPNYGDLIKSYERHLRHYNKLKKAIKLYDKLKCRNKDELCNKLMNLSLLQLSLNMGKSGEITLKKAIKLKPDMTRLKLFLADAYLEEGKIKKAFDLYKKEIKNEKLYEQEEEIKNKQISVYPCLDFVMVNCMVKVGKFETLSKRLKIIYTRYFSNSLSAYIFDDTLRLRLKEDPSFISSYKIYRTFFKKNILKSKFNDDLISFFNLFKKKKYFPATKILIKIYNKTDNIDEKIGISLLIKRMFILAPSLQNKFPDFQNITSKLIIKLPNDFKKDFLMAADYMMNNDFSNFAKHIVKYFKKDKKLLLIRELLDKTLDIDLNYISLEGNCKKYIPLKNEKIEKYKLLKNIAKFYLTKRRTSNIDILNLSTFLFNNGFKKAAIYILKNRKEDIDNFKAALTMERFYFELKNFSLAKEQHKIASQCKNFDEETSLKFLYSQEKREGKFLLKYFTSMKDSLYKNYNLSLINIDFSNINEAEKYIEKVNDKYKIFLQARVALLKADFNLSKKLFLKTLSQNSDDPESLKYLGIIYFTQGNFKKSEQFLKKSLDISKNDFDTMRYLATIYEKNGEFEKSRNMYERSIKLNGSGNPLIIKLYGDFLVRNGHISDAINLYNSIPEYKRSIDLYFNLALLYLKIKNYEKAEINLKIGLELSKYNSPRILYYYGVVESKLNRKNSLLYFEKSFKLFNNGIKDISILKTPYPCDAIIHTFSAIALGKWNKCNYILKQHLLELKRSSNDLLTDTEIIKGNIDFKTPFFFFFSTHPSSLLKNDDETDFFITKKGTPNSKRATFLAKFLNAQKNSDLFNSIKYGNKYLTIDKNLVLVRKIMGEIFRNENKISKNEFSTLMDKLNVLRENKKYKEAINLAITIEKKSHDNVELLNFMAETYWAQKKYELAEKYFKKVLKIKSDFFYAIVGLAYILRNEQKFKEASIYFLKASSLSNDKNEKLNYFMEGVYATCNNSNLKEAVKLLEKKMDKFDFNSKLINTYISYMRELHNLKNCRKKLSNWLNMKSKLVLYNSLISVKKELGEDIRKISFEALDKYPDNLEIASMLLTDLMKRNDKSSMDKLLSIVKKYKKKNSIIYYLEALKYKENGNRSQFLKFSKLAFNNKNMDYLKLYLEAMIENNVNNKEFTLLFRKFSKYFKDDPEIISPLFNLAIELKNFNMAQKIINIQSDLFPWGESWRLFQANLFIVTGREDKAIKLLEDSLTSQSSHSINLIIMLSDLYLQKLMMKKNRKLLLSITRNSKLTFNNLLLIFKQMMISKIYDGAFIIYKKMSSDNNPNNIERISKVIYDLPPNFLFGFINKNKELELDDNLLSILVGKEISSGQFKDAEKHLKKLLEENPDSPKLLLLMSKLYYQKNNYLEAETYIKKAMDMVPETYNELYEEIYFIGGKIELDLAEFKKAENYFKKSLEANNDPETIKYLAISYFVRGNYKKAEYYLKKSYKLDDSDVDCLRYLASVEEKLSKYDECEKIWKKAMNLNSGGQILITKLYADFKKRRGDIDGAINLYGELLFKIKSPDIYFNLGLLLYEAKRFNKAIDSFNSALRNSQKEQPRTHFYLGVTLFKLGKFEEAQKELKLSLKLFNEGYNDTINGKTPYPCRAIIYASSAVANGDYKKCGEVLLKHFNELKKTNNDLLTDIEIIKGNIDYITPFEIDFKFNPQHKVSGNIKIKLSIFGLSYTLLNKFIDAQKKNDLKNAILYGEKYIHSDPLLFTARERITKILNEKK